MQGKELVLKALRDKGVQSIAVCLLFSFLYPRHEQRIARIIREREAGGVGVITLPLIPSHQGRGNELLDSL